MKIRNGFVTNSSSSSFILAFTDKDAVDDTLLHDENISRCGYKWSGIVTDYVKLKSYEVTPESVIEDMRDRADWDLDTQVICALLGHFATYKEEQEFKKTQEYKDELERTLNNCIKRFKKDIKDRPYLLRVDVSDHDNSDLEHDIFPRIKNVVHIFNNH